MLLENKLKHFEALLESAKKFKQQSREKTFFDTAIRNHYENPTTELLEFFLNPQESHELGEVFWKGFSDVIQAEVGEVSDVLFGQIERLERECATGKEVLAEQIESTQQWKIGLRQHILIFS